MDKRQEKTLDAIYEAFTKLINSKDYDEITIQDILNESKIGRSTFYCHFKDKNELLLSISRHIFEHVFSHSLKEEATHDFSKEEKKLTKVGVAGEIYIKCSPIGNRHLEALLQDNGYDYKMEGFLNYCTYVVYTEMKCAELNRAPAIELWVYKKVIRYMMGMQRKLSRVLTENGFLCDGNFDKMREKSKDILSEYYNIGDGWLVMAEAIHMLEQGYNKILIVHPFGCLVSHVAERGVLKKLRKLYPEATINTIEYDYEQSKTLRDSRIMLATQ